MAGLSAASVAAIAELGLGSGIRFDEDMVPALNAVGIQPETDQPYVFNDARSKGFYMPTTREHVERSLSALDLTDAEVVERVLRFAKRIAELYEASRDPDRAKLVRLRLALADDGYTIDTDTQGEGDMARVSIDRRAIAQYMKLMQEEFDKHPIRIPVTADPAAPGAPTPQTTIYNGPVFHGDANGAQLAWGNQAVNQNQQRTEQIAPGFEAIAAAVAEALKGLPAVGLPEEDEQDATAAANEVLAEVTQSNPDRGKIRAALARVRGYLAPIAMAGATGATEGVHDWAKTAVEQLATIPF